MFKKVTKGRFIAGAVCPLCREMDRLLLRSTAQGDERECVACGFSDRVSDHGAEPQDLSLLPAGKLDAIATTRRTAASATAGGNSLAQPVRIVQPSRDDQAAQSDATATENSGKKAVARPKKPE